MIRVPNFVVCLAMLVASAVKPAFAQQMAITFDDLPAHGDLPPNLSRLAVAQSILQTIKREKLPPVYGFVNGVRVAEDPSTASVLHAWRAAGEPLGNHTWSHPDLEKITPAEFEADAEKNERLLRKLMGAGDWHWFRYPFLHEGETLEKHQAVRAWLGQHHYKVADVNMDFEDYLWNAPYARCAVKHDEVAIQTLHDSYLATADAFIDVFKTLSAEAYGRDVKYVLLLHLGAFDARMLPDLLALYRRRGFSFISLPEAEQDPAYAVDPDFGVKYGGTQLDQIAAKRKLKIPHEYKPYKDLEAICR